MKLYHIYTGLNGYEVYDQIIMVAKDAQDAHRWYTDVFAAQFIAKVRDTYLADFRIEEIDLDSFTEAEDLLTSYTGS